MPSKAQSSTKQPVASHPIYLNEGLSSKKTVLIIVTVVGCIAILWPKVFYPMMFGGSKTVKTDLKETQRGPGGCCEVVLNREEFYNATIKKTSSIPAEPFGPQLYRRSLNIYTGEITIRQERPVHLHPDAVYQAMRERGRAIPATPTIPIVDRKVTPSNPPPRIVEGRPGPIPGMRPPLGAGAMHQPQTKGSSMGIIMPLYTIGIVVFFGYTIMKIVFKKPIPNAPYGPAPSDPNFRKQVFGYENGRHLEDLNGSKLGTNLHKQPESQRNGNELYNASLSAANVASTLSASLKQQQQQQQQQQRHSALPHQQQQQIFMTAKLLNKETEQLMEIEKLRKKLEDTEKAMAKLIAEMNSDQYEAKMIAINFIKPAIQGLIDAADEELKLRETSTSESIKKTHEKTTTNKENISNGHANVVETSGINADKTKHDHLAISNSNKLREGSTERTIAVLGMEITASCEGGQKWSGRPPTPVLLVHHEHSKPIDDYIPEPQSIYLEGILAHESQILVADSEIKQEKVYDAELNGSADEPAVVLSSKMTLSLINLDNISDKHPNKTDIESPLADDIEIIGHDEN
uniref:Resistance to inhibitors of cholinesterase protein 3 N-terminal domain-containing protein n=1 Tax=Glossina morsitans morsitans TaxID=37546 RepID=A0A1B0GC77_GLOMM